jgi:hypothetical protein
MAKEVNAEKALEELLGLFTQGARRQFDQFDQLADAQRQTAEEIFSSGVAVGMAAALRLTADGKDIREMLEEMLSTDMSEFKTGITGRLPEEKRQVDRPVLHRRRRT